MTPYRKISRSAIALALLLGACATDSGGPEPASPAPVVGALIQLDLSAVLICFTPHADGSYRPDDVRVTSTDGTVIPGLTAAIRYETGQPTGWLSTAFDQNVTPARLWLTATPGALPAGAYKAFVDVSAPGTVTRTIEVQLKVGEPSNLRTLTIDLTRGIGPGTGRITGEGIDCRIDLGVTSGDCTGQFPEGVPIPLSLEVASNSLIQSISADPNRVCQFPAVGPPYAAPIPCEVTLTAGDGTLVVALSGLPGSLTVAVQGSGANGDVLSGGIFGQGTQIDCQLRNGVQGNGPAGACTTIGPEGGVQNIRLEATPLPGSVFTGWTGACTGTDPVCFVNFTVPNTTATATATFALE